MPRHYPAEVRRASCERMLAGEAVKVLVAELGISGHTLYRWPGQRTTAWVKQKTDSWRCDHAARRLPVGVRAALSTG
jgi:hypothetical protein